MSKISTNNVYKPSDNLPNMIIKNIVWALAGIILGVLINNIIIYITNTYANTYAINTTNTNIILLEISIQLILCSVILAIIHTNFHDIGWSWQNTTAGFIFVSFFFGVQYNIFINIQKTLIIDKIVK
jgi:hypothetical protein